MNYLSPLDAAFLRMETKRTPMHVGAMMTFKLPDDAPPDFVRKLMEQMRSKPFMPTPFNCLPTVAAATSILKAVWQVQT